MRTFLTALVIGLVSTMVATAGLFGAAEPVAPDRTALNAAEALWAQTNYPGCISALEKWKSDYPAANIELRAEAQHYVWYTLSAMGKSAEAKAAAEQELKDYPNVSPCTLVYAAQYLADSLFNAGKYVEAQTAYQQILTDYTALGALYYYRSSVAHCLRMQGKIKEANAMWMDLAVKNVREFGAKDEQGHIWATFNLVNPTLLTTAEYKAFLEDMIKATPATETNAKFLGRLKSELGKMQ